MTRYAILLTLALSGCGFLASGDATYAKLDPATQATVQLAADHAASAAAAVASANPADAILKLTQAINEMRDAKANAKDKDGKPVEIPWTEMLGTVAAVLIGVRMRHNPVVGGKPDPRVAKQT